MAVNSTLIGAFPIHQMFIREHKMNLRADITRLVDSIPLADTHEHILEEKSRLEPGDGARLDDFAVLFNDYSSADLRNAGMPSDDLDRFLRRGVDWQEKWRLVKPYYEAARNTGYLQATRISVQRLYGEDDITDSTVGRINEKVRKMIAPGFTGHIVKEVANIDHCQVNSLEESPFMETAHPDFLLQDIGTPTLICEWKHRRFWSMAGIEVKSIYDYHKVLDAIFEQLAPRAVATKNQMNYGRRLDYADVKAEEVASIFERSLASDDQLPWPEEKAIQDHLFNYCARKATEYKLPVKLHAGYYSGNDRMPLSRLMYNGSDMCELLMLHPQTPILFMHINYPYQSELVAVCKQYTNAYADMCWGWIINPAASVRFLKEFLMAVPVNKILTFGGDYRAVECVPGHAAIARRGIAQALSELVEEGWLRESDVEFTANRIMRDNARELFRVSERFGI